ncbi:PEP-CTERM sorting domain-containing protein [Candidatus Bathyarchaeota archaeon]|nr:PEP-CTERM sorting domain-containing protein [Candidatus Bathyarchaeota archaeon]MBS7631044.1 PEP-CTERM sorting domain-containing protein [Candidatus Bathyarchaeota archaeon]
MKSLKKYASMLALMFLVIPLIVGLAVVNASETGSIRVLPSVPIRLQTTFHFSVETIGDDPVAFDPIIFLVMTKESYDGLTGVTIEWSGGGVTFPKTSFSEEDDGSVKLPSEASPTIQYFVASLKEKLGTTGPIYWSYNSFLGDVITRKPKEFTVTLYSSKPNMLVYVFGKSSPSATEYDMRSVIIESQVTAFHVPEPVTILGLSASIAALIGYSAKRRKCF